MLLTGFETEASSCLFAAVSLEIFIENTQKLTKRDNFIRNLPVCFIRSFPSNEYEVTTESQFKKVWSLD